MWGQLANHLGESGPLHGLDSASSVNYRKDTELVRDGLITVAVPRRHSIPSSQSIPVSADGLLRNEKQIVVSSVATLEQLERFSDGWNDLIRKSPARLPMSSYAYVRPYLEHQLETGEGWKCLFAHAGDRLVGVLPLVFSTSTILGIRRKRYRAPSNTHIPSVTAIAAEGYESTVLRAFLDELAVSDPGYFSLSFSRIHERAAILRANEESFVGVRLIKDFVGNGSFLPIERDFPTYLSTLSANHRRNLRRWAGRLSQLPDAQFQFLSGDTATNEIAEQFFALEASGWKGARHSAILSCQRRSEFYRSMINRLRDAGWLELHLLSADGKVIAGQMAMKLERSLVIWKIAYDESYSFCGPGNLLFEKGLERAFLKGDVDEVNCLTDMAWHKSWRMSSRPYYDVYIYPKRAITFMAGVIPKRTRNFIRALPGIRPFVHLIRTVLSV